MAISQAGSLNLTALVVPDLYVQIVTPQNYVINGVPTNVIGVVGTASWGPVNTATLMASAADLLRSYGPIQARKYDLGTPVLTAIQQGAQAFVGVRVTDGTDVAATTTINQGSGTQSATLTALYTGSLGNKLAFTLSTGSQAGTFKATVSLPGVVLGEVFDNIPSVTPAAFWAALVSAINAGNSPTRGPSKLVIATIGTGTALNTTPVALTAPAFTGGADGVTTITSSVLIGADVIGARTGMYALRGQGVSIGILSDSDDPTTWTLQAAFGLSEGVYMMLAGPKGDTIASAVAAKYTAGLDSYACKLFFGDWLYWNDQTNGISTRLVSPVGFAAGRLANLSPEQSSLNKPLYGIVGSQRLGVVGTAQSNAYSALEESTLFQAGIDVITNPGAGGQNIWTVRCGHNSSSNASTNGDTYTRLTNYIATTLAAGIGFFVGKLINSGLFQDIRATALGFFSNMLQRGQLGSTDGTVPFNAVCDLSNNPTSRTSLGYVQLDCQVKYQGINEKFIVNLEGGTTVNVTQQTTINGSVNR